ncbi:MAG: hypothetical protein Q4G70_00355 [Pseudomonadota bacterium]|nr:hypothetical protein [Pseudomonadota bacterium]
MRALFLLSTLVIAASLTACGGDDNQPPAANPYAGTYKSVCGPSEANIGSEAGPAAYSHLRVALTAADGGKLNSLIHEDFYAADNQTCSGSPLHTVAYNKSNSLTLQGSKPAKLPDGRAVTADKVIAEEHPIGGLSAGGSIHINGLVLPADYFMRRDTAKGIASLQASRLYLRFAGGTTPVGADGYPVDFGDYYLVRQ